MAKTAWRRVVTCCLMLLLLLLLVSYIEGDKGVVIYILLHTSPLKVS